MADVASSADNAAQSATIPLSIPARLVCGVVGVAAGGAGAVAVFVSSNGLGAAVLLAVGTLFLLMAASGLPVIRAKIGDNELVLARLQRIEQNSQQTNVAVERLEDHFADSVYAVQIHDVLHFVGYKARRGGIRGLAGWPYFYAFWVGEYNGIRVRVSSKHEMTDPATVDILREQLERRNASQADVNVVPDHHLVVTSSRNDLVAAIEREGLPGVRVAVWQQLQDTDELRAALDEITTA